MGAKKKTFPMPYEHLPVKNNTLSIDVESSKRLVLFTGNKDKLAGLNEFQCDTRIQTGYGVGINDSTKPFDNGVGTLRILNPVSDNVWLYKTDGTGKAKTMSSGYLQANSMRTVDTATHSVTVQDVVIKNDQASNSSIVIDSCDATTGWSAIYGTVSSITVENGRIKVIGTTSATGQLAIQKVLTATDLSNYPFISLNVECTDCNIYFLASSSTTIATYKYWQGSRFPTTTGGVKYVLPLFSPAGTVGAMATTVGGSTDYTSIVRLRVGISDAGNAVSKTFYFDNITADTGKLVNVECLVPDNLTYNPSAVKIYSYNGSVYGSNAGLLIPAENVTTAATNASSNANITFSDGTPLSAVYGTVAPKYAHSGISEFKLGTRNQTITDCTLNDGTARTLTFSGNYGTKQHIGFSVLMPPGDGGRTKINEFRIKLVAAYDDETKNKSYVVGSTVRGPGYLQFPGSIGSRVEVPLSSAFYQPDTFMFMFSSEVSSGEAYHGVWLDKTNGAKTRILLGQGASTELTFQGDIGTSTNLSIGYGNVTYDTKANYAITYDGSAIKLWKNGAVVRNYTGLSGKLINSPSAVGWIGNGYGSAYSMKGKLYNFSYFARYDESLVAKHNASGITADDSPDFFLIPSVKNMGITTHEFSNTTDYGQGLQLMSKPYFCLYDPAGKRAEYYVLTKKPIGGSFSYDETGKLCNVKFTLEPGTRVSRGQLKHVDLTADSDSNQIPDFLDSGLVSVNTVLGHLGFTKNKLMQFGFWPSWNGDPDTYTPDWSTLTHVAYHSWGVNVDGTLTDPVDMVRFGKVKTLCNNNGKKLILSILSTTTATMDAVIATNYTAFANNVLAKLISTGAEGVNIDFEGILSTNSVTGTANLALFETFLSTLYTTLKAANPNYHVSMCVAGGYLSGAYRNSNLNQYLDSIFIMGYDYNLSTTGANSPYNDPAKNDVVDAVNTVSTYFAKNKIILGLPLYGYTFTSATDLPESTITAHASITLQNAVAAAVTYGRLWDSASSTPYVKYQDGEQWHQIWYDDAESLKIKYDYILSNGLAGVGYWALGYETGYTQALAVFRQ